MKRELASSALADMGCRLSGFPELDRAIGGLWPRDLVLIASCDDGGKTALALNIAEHLALNYRLPVAYFSTHTGADQLVARVVASIGRIALDNFRTGVMSEHETHRLKGAEYEFQQSGLHIEANLGWDLKALRSRALIVTHRLGNLGLLIIDSLDYITLGQASEVKGTSLRSSTVQSCATLASELACPVIALMRIPASVEVRGDARPVLSDLALSARELRCARTILSIYRDDQYTGVETLESGLAQIRVHRNRFGDAVSLKLAFLKCIAKFENLAINV